MTEIPFNHPTTVGNEFAYIRDAIERRQLSSGGAFGRRCCAWLERETGCRKALLTHSCTAALEMAALLLEIEPGDEVIMPSFTFVSTANAVVLRGGMPVFVDIRPDTLNIDETRIEAAITPRTKAVVAVHYAGVPCEMDTVCAVAGRHGLIVVEDAAQALLSSYKGRSAGALGALGAISFHETKNVISGEGGALLVNDVRWVERADVLWNKGTDRSRYFLGEVDRYSWVDLGSSFGLSELNAAFLWAQLEVASALYADRMRTWQLYHEGLADCEARGLLRRPVIPEEVRHNAHMYYVLLPDLERRTAFIEDLKRRGVSSVFHYVPLHSSVAGRRYARSDGDLPESVAAAERLVRLPVWSGMPESDAERVIDAVVQSLATRGSEVPTEPRPAR